MSHIGPVLKFVFGLLEKLGAEKVCNALWPRVHFVQDQQSGSYPFWSVGSDFRGTKVGLAHGGFFLTHHYDGPIGVANANVKLKGLRTRRSAVGWVRTLVAGSPREHNLGIGLIAPDTPTRVDLHFTLSPPPPSQDLIAKVTFTDTLGHRSSVRKARFKALPETQSSGNQPGENPAGA